MDKRRRLGWIASCLRFAGRLGPREKKILVATFGMSEATISRDQAALFEMLPDNGSVILEGGKLEVADPADLRLPYDLPEPSLDEWLKVMLASRYVSTTGVERVEPSSNTIRTILKAIQDRRALFIRYVSRSAPEPTWRAVSPHAVVDVVGRYHTRCFDHRNGRYGDFVLTRILGATFDRSDTPDYVDGGLDREWYRTVDVRVSLKEGEAPLVGRLDYGLGETGSRIIRMRKALVPYVIDHRYEGFEDPVKIREVEKRGE
jgi:hypothetical protein